MLWKLKSQHFYVNLSLSITVGLGTSKSGQYSGGQLRGVVNLVRVMITNKWKEKIWAKVVNLLSVVNLLGGGQHEGFHCTSKKHY